MQDAERLRYVEDNQVRLQGLRYAPYGAMIVLMSLLNAFVGSPESFFDFNLLRDGSLLGLMLAATLLSVRAGSRYERRFGRVVRPGRRGSSVGRPGLVILLVLALGMFLAPPVKEDLGGVGSSVLSGLLLVSVVLLLPWSDRSRFTFHWPILTALGLLASLLPLLGVVPVPNPALGPLPVGLVLFIGSLLDHLLLVRSLGSDDQ